MTIVSVFFFAAEARAGAFFVVVVVVVAFFFAASLQVRDLETQISSYSQTPRSRLQQVGKGIEEGGGARFLGLRDDWLVIFVVVTLFIGSFICRLKLHSGKQRGGERTQREREREGEGGGGKSQSDRPRRSYSRER